jgi:hypothetical protein
MTSDRGFNRSLIYLGLMALLLLPLSYLGQPAVSSKDRKQDEQTTSGLLADMREEYELSQTSIGEIDPAGATMQMLLLGGNGFAINKLWGNAMEAQKTEDWETLRATLEQLVKLQPHYFKVWDYLAHNQSYNMSVEFDDYRARYKQVVTGFNFLKESTSTRTNRAYHISWVGTSGTRLVALTKNVITANSFRMTGCNCSITQRIIPIELMKIVITG